MTRFTALNGAHRVHDGRTHRFLSSDFVLHTPGKLERPEPRGLFTRIINTRPVVKFEDTIHLTALSTGE